MKLFNIPWSIMRFVCLFRMRFIKIYRKRCIFPNLISISCVQNKIQRPISNFSVFFSARERLTIYGEPIGLWFITIWALLNALYKLIITNANLNLFWLCLNFVRFYSFFLTFFSTKHICVYFVAFAAVCHSGFVAWEARVCILQLVILSVYFVVVVFAFVFVLFGIFPIFGGVFFLVAFSVYAAGACAVAANAD